MNKPNTVCSICKVAIYRKPSYIQKQDNVYCLSCTKTLDFIKRRNVNASTKKAKNVHIHYIKRWKAGFETGLSGETALSSHIRKYLFEKFDNKCCKCGWNEVNVHTNRKPLEVNHIDGNYLNNKEDNLELICPNCHSLTPSYRGLNKGRGRPYRKF